MSAYPENQMYNMLVRQNANEAFDEGILSTDSYQKINENHACNFYSPNLFVAIGIGLFTVVTTIMITLLLILLSSISSTSGFIGICTLMAMFCYGMLEFLVNSRHHFNSGADNVLLLLVSIFIGAMFFMIGDEPLWIYFSLTIFLICGWLWYRFVDSVMAIFSVASFIFFSATLFDKTGPFAQNVMPVFTMCITALLYILLRLKMPIEHNQYYKSYKVVKIFLLITFYLAGNIFIIDDISREIYHRLKPIPFHSFYWLTTFLIPLAYMIIGFLKRNLLILRPGLFLLAASIFTYKYYFTFLPIEWEMLFVGAILVLISYLLFKYFKDGKNGFTSEKYTSSSVMDNLQALIVTETLTTRISSGNSLMDGGSGGGAGASGDF